MAVKEENSSVLFVRNFNTSLKKQLRMWCLENDMNIKDTLTGLVTGLVNADLTLPKPEKKKKKKKRNRDQED